MWEDEIGMKEDLKEKLAIRRTSSTKEDTYAL